MPDGIFLERDGHKTWLKWHRGHKQAGDISFTWERIAEGMRLGASLEIDLLCQAGGGFVVLHDKTLDRATTGTGPVATATPEHLATLKLRDAAGNPTDHPVMLFDTLCQRLAGQQCGDGALLQLDMKEGAAALGDRQVAAFAAAVEPVKHLVILSGGDAEAVSRLSAAVPGMRIGYDPCHFGVAEETARTGEFERFVETALADSPNAEMIYLEYELVLTAERAGFDLVAAFHAAGRRIDAYTITGATAENHPAVARLLSARVDQITTDDPVGLEMLMTG
ncbi:glycerophosphodiester phosphodiesterase [Rhizobium sp. PAMB 3174]